MKSIFTGLLITMIPALTFSQTRLSKTYQADKGQKIEFKFDYPKIIHISTWDKNEISVEASVNINGGKNDSAFTLDEVREGGKISISNKIDMSQINEIYSVVLNGVKTQFDNKKDFENFKKDKSGISYYNQRDIKVTIRIKLPAGINTDVVSVYGMVELDNVNGPIKVDAKYGGIDASLNESKIGKIKITNHFGKIYSDLDLKPTAQEDKNFYTSITASPGTGPSYDINSSYGNIYLRKITK